MSRSLLETSVVSARIKNRLLVYSTCIEDEHPGALKEFGGYTCLGVCMASSSLEKTAWKLATIGRVKGLRKVAALTMDGFPHCLQLHFALGDVKEMFPGLKAEHYVIEKGEVKRVSGRSVKAARHLHDVEELCDAQD